MTSEKPLSIISEKIYMTFLPRLLRLCILPLMLKHQLVLLKTIAILVCSISKAKGFIHTRKLAEAGSVLTG